MFDLQKTAPPPAVVSGHIGNNYVTSMRSSMEQLRQIITDEVWVNRIFEVSGASTESILCLSSASIMIVMLCRSGTAAR